MPGDEIDIELGGAVGVSDVDTVVPIASEYYTVVLLAVLGPPSSCIVGVFLALGKTKSRFAQNSPSSLEAPRTSNG